MLRLGCHPETPVIEPCRGKRYPLPALLSLAVIAMLAGMTTYAAIVQYGRERGSERDWRCLWRRPWLKLRASG